MKFAGFVRLLALLAFAAVGVGAFSARRPALAILGGARVGQTSFRLNAAVVPAKVQTAAKGDDGEKRALKQAIKEVRTKLATASQEGKNSLVGWVAKTSLKVSGLTVKLFIAVRQFIAALLEALKSKLPTSLSSSRPSKSLPSSVPSKPSAPKITSTLLPIDEAKAVVKKKLDAEAVATPLASTTTTTSTSTAATATAAPSVSAVAAKPAVAVTTAVAASSETALASPTPSTSTSASSDSDLSSSSSSSSSDAESSGALTMEKIKSFGTSGLIAYFVSELGFWLLAVPAAYYGYHAEFGTWLSLDSDEDRGKILASILTFVTGARLLVPVRISIALALVPVVDYFRGQQGDEEGDKEGGEKDSSS